MKNLSSEEEILNIPSETEQIEFKRLGDGSNVVKKVLQTIVAMANTNGGHIILGVNDPEQNDLRGRNRILGIEENQENYDEIRQRLPDISPEPHLKFHEIQTSDGKTIAIIAVEKAEEYLHHINNESFIRLKKGNHRLTMNESFNFQYSRGFRKADEELVSISRMGLLETESYKKWRDNKMADRGGESIEFILESKGLAREDGDGILRPTRAAVMLFAEYPNNLLTETKCAIQIMVYKGKEEVFGNTPNLIRNETLNAATGTLIEKTHRYVLEELKDGLTIKSGFDTKYKIPDRAIMEAITNAVIHRDYHAKLYIEIKIFEDRVEIWNAGLFPSNITPQNIGTVRASGYRNNLLVKTLGEFPAPPNFERNEGVRAMRKKMHEQNLFPPVFKILSLQSKIPDSICLTLWSEQPPVGWKEIERYLEEERSINNETAREVTGITDPEKIYSLLKKCTAKGVLIPIESTGKRGRLYKKGF